MASGAGAERPTHGVVRIGQLPGQFLRHRTGEVWKDADDGSVLFKADATWRKLQGQGDGNGVSFEASNFPGSFLRHRGGLFFSEPLATQLDRDDATFHER